MATSRFPVTCGLHQIRPKAVSSATVALTCAVQVRCISQSTSRGKQLQGQRTRRPQLSQQPRHIYDRRTLATSAQAPVVEALPELDLSSIQTRVNELAQSLLLEKDPSKVIPSEQVVLSVLREYESFAQKLESQKDVQPRKAPGAAESTATSALLKAVHKKQTTSKITKAALISLISQQADTIVEAPATFITPEILKTYVSLQSLLNRPQPFAHILSLYRTKPVPRPSKTAPYITFSNPNPNSPAAAVPPATADIALTAAITAHDLPLALSVVENTYCTTAYKRSKFLRSALFPLAGAVLTPLAAYTLASRFAVLQNTMDPSSATNIAMAGILTYTTAVATIGYVALTTANDQMVRVTWATGLPLWERWTREEERSAVDRVAQAWGFKSVDRWGEEEGVEWESLREWVGLRGMVLDRVELMEGME